MELIRISQDKIKISLTKSDLDAYDISVDSIDYQTEQTRNVFKELFGKAKNQTGFDADGEKVFVQIYTARDGGCEIFISKLNKPALPEKKQYKTTVFVFDELKALLCACKQLVRLGYSGDSDAYADGNKRFFLVLNALRKTENAYLREFGEPVEDTLIDYIREHANLIKSSDAVQILSPL